jgi:HprK-related kinase A
MLTVADLPRHELAARLAGPGLVLRTGPFANRIRSDVPQLLEGIALLYADYPVGESGGFADFHLSLHRSGGLRRWFRPQVCFEHEGMAPFKPLPLAQAYPMFEWVMNWCVTHRAHSYLIIHAAVLERHGRAVLLPAPPGSGKSTLCAALVTRGWRLLSDEMTLVRLEDGAVLPLPRPVSLKNESIGVIRAYAPDAVLSRPVENTNKGTIAHLKAPGASIDRASDLARPAFIVFPRYEPQAAISLAPLPKARAFMGVAENAFNYQVLGMRGFTALGALIDATTAFEFRYSKLDEAVQLFERLAKDGA